MNYFLYGTDQGRIQKEINRIITSLKKEHECDVVTYNLNNTPLNEVLQEVMTPPFFAQHKVIVANHANFLVASQNQNIETYQLEEILTHPLLENTFILTGNYEKPDARKKIVKLIQSTCKTQSFNRLNEQEKKTYIYAKIKEYNLKVSDSLKNMIVERLPLDTQIIDMQLEKCALYPDALDETILSALLTRQLEDNIFQMIEAILKGKSKTAFKLAQDMMDLNHDPIYLIAVMASQIRFYYQVKVLSLRGLSTEAIAKELNAHPYRVKLTYQNVQGMKSDVLLALLEKLASCDQKVKSGQLPKKLAFELFLLQSQGVVK